MAYPKARIEAEALATRHFIKCVQTSALTQVQGGVVRGREFCSVAPP